MTYFKRKPQKKMWVIEKRYIMQPHKSEICLSNTLNMDHSVT